MSVGKPGRAGGQERGGYLSELGDADAHRRLHLRCCRRRCCCLDEADAANQDLAARWETSGRRRRRSRTSGRRMTTMTRTSGVGEDEGEVRRHHRHRGSRWGVKSVTSLRLRQMSRTSAAGPGGPGGAALARPRAIQHAVGMVAGFWIGGTTAATGGEGTAGAGAAGNTDAAAAGSEAMAVGPPGRETPPSPSPAPEKMSKERTPCRAGRSAPRIAGFARASRPPVLQRAVRRQRQQPAPSSSDSSAWPAGRMRQRRREQAAVVDPTRTKRTR